MTMPHYHPDPDPAAECADDLELPDGFDPKAFPIISAHWFGIGVDRRAAEAYEQAYLLSVADAMRRQPTA